ncbi:GPP34 family phosphoprotein [Streptomyces sp. JHA26]|uniref:GOLPH3/VPS74 family protein n=1 Tax=Streptomyces sp. JHA26 TaxID=1917143 RepID=UPI00098BCAF1|nr:GPP34 family phosphoprotein [Streptomyces sp. JHA26]
MPNGSLSPPARLCLLAWDPARPGTADTARLHHLVRAGALAELARRGLLVDDDGIATPVDLDRRTGDAVLDGLLDLVRESVPRRWRAWVRPYARVTFDAVREQLVAGGYLRAEKKRVLGVFPSVDHVLARVAAARVLREEAREVLDGPLPAREVPARDALVVALAAAAELRALGPVGDRARRRGRIEELTACGATAAPGLGKVLREVRAAVSAEAARAVTPAGG